MDPGAAAGYNSFTPAMTTPASANPNPQNRLVKRVSSLAISAFVATVGDQRDKERIRANSGR